MEIPFEFETNDKHGKIKREYLGEQSLYLFSKIQLDDKNNEVGSLLLKVVVNKKICFY